MRARFGILVLALVMVLAGCGGDDKKSAGASSSSTQADITTPTDPMTEVTISCPEFAAAAQKIAKAQQDMYTNRAATDALNRLASELEALKEGAPENVKNAIDDLIAAFRATKAERPQWAAKSAEAGKTLADYIVSKCTS